MDEIHSTHTVTSGFPAEVQVDFQEFIIPQRGDGFNPKYSFNYSNRRIWGDLLILHQHIHMYSIDGGNINSTLKFRINASWDDEPELN